MESPRLFLRSAGPTLSTTLNLAGWNGHAPSHHFDCWSLVSPGMEPPHSNIPEDREVLSMEEVLDTTLSTVHQPIKKRCWGRSFRRSASLIVSRNVDPATKFTTEAILHGLLGRTLSVRIENKAINAQMTMPPSRPSRIRVEIPFCTR